jgi:BirA family biotin operon repressor/biotin-[acetyl-CoA-carboxylase] ligase
MELDTVLAPLDGLDVGAIRRQFVGEVIGTHMYVFADVGSTNAALRDLADAGAHEGTVVPSEVPIFSFIASLALTEAIWALGVPAGVKWPNDVMIAGRKVAGTRLDVGLAGDRVTYVVVGVGVNVNVLHAQLEAGLGAAAADATSLREAVGRPVERNTLAASFLNHLEKWLGLYRSSGPETIVSAWQKRDVLTGHRVAVQGLDGTFTGRVAVVEAAVPQPAR